MKNKLEIKNYWWEDSLDSMLLEYSENSFLGSSDIKLFILKAIESEVENRTDELMDLLNGEPIKIKKQYELNN